MDSDGLFSGRRMSTPSHGLYDSFTPLYLRCNSGILWAMAIFQSNIISDIRGSVGNVTFSRTRQGLVMKARTTYDGGNSSPQIQQRGAINQISSVWRMISEAEREAWRSYASLFTDTDRLGRPYTPTGYSVFMSVNRDRFLFSNGVRNAPPEDRPMIIFRPVPEAPATPPDNPIYFQDGEALFAILFDTPVDDWNPLLFISLPESAGRTYARHGVYLCGQPTGIIGGIPAIDFESDYNALLSRNGMSTDKSLYYGRRVFWELWSRDTLGSYKRNVFRGSNILQQV